MDVSICVLTDVLIRVSPDLQSALRREAKPMAELSDDLKLTDFMDLAALQEIQDGFAAIANVKAVITDPAGNRLTSPDPTSSFLLKRDVIATQEESVPETQRVGREYVAPIRIGHQQLGMIRMRGGGDSLQLDDDRAAKLATRFNVDPKMVRDLVAVATKDRNRRPAAIQFLFLLANAIARLCYQEFQLRLRINELQTISTVTVMLSETRDLEKVLQRAVKLVAELMNVKACSIRLIDHEKDELSIKAVYNLSEAYINKGMISLSRRNESFDDDGTGYEYVRDMRTDPRVQYPDAAASEGLVSMMGVAMRHQGRDVGMLRVYTDQERNFTPGEIQTLKAIAATAASAIENARLEQENRESALLEQQINMAADVQQRMIPQTPPQVPGLELASVYVPCYQLGGDLFDFIELPYDNIGIVIADVSGKGVPASLVMASVRAALRAQADNVYYVSEIMSRINQMLVRDTKSTEFVTTFYGVIDAKNKRLTYCNAGHSPAMLLRADGSFLELGVGDQGSMVLGVLAEETFRQNFFDLQTGDTLLLYTDGLSEARGFGTEMFGRQRVIDSFKKGGATAEDVARNILWDLRRFVGLAPATDDVTIVTVRVK
jgi:phosphoserine phosphatase RsbU/P